MSNDTRDIILNQVPVVPIAIFGPESLTLREVDPHKRNVFEIRYLIRSILGFTIMDKVRNNVK